MFNFLYFLGANNKLLFNFLRVWKRIKRFLRNLKLKFEQEYLNGTLSIIILILVPTLSLITSVEVVYTDIIQLINVIKKLIWWYI